MSSKIMERLFQQREDGMYTILVEKGAMRIEVGDDHGGTRKPIDRVDHDKRRYRRGTKIQGYQVVDAYYPFPDNWFDDKDPRWTKVEPMTGTLVEPMAEDIRISVIDHHVFTCWVCRLRYCRGSDSYANAWATGSTLCIPCRDEHIDFSKIHASDLVAPKDSTK